MRTPKAFLVERGRRIAWLRRQHKVTQEVLAKVIKAHREAVTEIEQGRRDLSLSEAILIAGTLKVGVEWLNGDGPSLTNWKQ